MPVSLVRDLHARVWLDSWWVGVVCCAVLAGAVLVSVRVLRRRCSYIWLTVLPAAVLTGRVRQRVPGYVPDRVAAERLLGLTTWRRRALLPPGGARARRRVQ